MNTNIAKFVVMKNMMNYKIPKECHVKRNVKITPRNKMIRKLKGNGKYVNNQAPQPPVFTDFVEMSTKVMMLVVNNAKLISVTYAVQLPMKH